MEFLYVVSFQGNPPHSSSMFRIAFQSPEMINFVVSVTNAPANNIIRERVLIQLDQVELLSIFT